MELNNEATIIGWRGHYYYRARIYSAQVGRFVSRDPIGYDDGINVYEYCGDDPLVRTDPAGLQSSRVPCDAMDVAACKKTCRDDAPKKPHTIMRVTCDTCKYAKIDITILANGTIIETRTPVCECEYEDRCSKAAHATLQAQVDSLCKGRKKGKQCNNKMTKYEMFANALKFQACAIAREAINQACYGGGDDGHRIQAANHMRAYGKCMELYKNKP